MPTPRKYATAADRQRAYRERTAKARADELASKGLPPAPTIPTMPGERRWTASIDQARALLDQTKDEMQAYADDRSEAWRESDRGETLQEKISALEALISDLDELTSS